MKFIIKLLNLLLILTLLPVEYSMSEDKPGNESNFKIIFWISHVLDMEVLQESTYPELISKFEGKLSILSDKYISKYYWDEQLIEFEEDRMENETGRNFPVIGGGLFSIVLNNRFIYHGLCRMLRSPDDKYYDSNYPTIIEKRSVNPRNRILALKPRYLPMEDIYRDYDEKEQKRILNQEVLNYFEKQGKIVRGKIDLEKLLAYKHVSERDSTVPLDSDSVMELFRSQGPWKTENPGTHPFGDEPK